VEGDGITQKVMPGPKMANPLAPCLIDNRHGYFLGLHPMLPGCDQYFHLKLVAPCFYPQLQGLGKGIEPEPRLGIFHPWPTGRPDPEVGKPATESAGPGHIFYI